MRRYLPRPLLPSSTTFIQRVPRHMRCISTPSGKDEPGTTASLNPRWLSDVKARIGKCINFGLRTEQTQEACLILEEIAKDWRHLLAGSEGFLTDKNRIGLFRQEVVWGEMVLAPPATNIGSTAANGLPRFWYLLALDVTTSKQPLTCVTGHVNNVVYNRYAESARVNWGLNYGALDPANKKQWLELMTPRSIGLILRSIKTDYKFPMKYPDRVTVLHKLRNMPEADTDHFILDVLILSELHQRPAARCIEDIVVYDYKAARKSPLKPFMVDKFRETFELQEQAKSIYGNRVTELLKRTRELEKVSWDRVDAVEDMGPANA
ncbi:thioesterase-like superfamily-domain-containing protein [Lophiotrema nucula]|uniref:Thioesterase-like superfamily-domain-containing protein n=1 Tax=Lophiotrema nucula TaxID=690887 RepID=A0A6A5ZSU6_9PLEO|nr:thioesterase-like superfamily-domain-containing protein [Lophiotrema nucula]